MLGDVEADVNPGALLQAVVRTIIELHIQAQFTQRRSYTGAFCWRWMRCIFILYCSTTMPA